MLTKLTVFTFVISEFLIFEFYRYYRKPFKNL